MCRSGNGVRRFCVSVLGAAMTGVTDVTVRTRHNAAQNTIRGTVWTPSDEACASNKSLETMSGLKSRERM